MRLTKSDCIKLSNQILQKRIDEFEIKLEELKGKIYKHMKSKVPYEVMETFSKFPKYFKTSYVSLSSFRSSVTLDFPCETTNSYSITDTNETLLKEYKVIVDMYSKIQQTREPLVTHLFKLGTLKRVQDLFPEVSLEAKEKSKELSIITPELLKWLK